MEKINDRMTRAGRADDFMDKPGQEHLQVIDNADVQVSRINDIITDFNRTKDDLRAAFTEIARKVIENDQKLAAVPELTANVTTLFEGTQQFALKFEKDLAELHKQTSEFAQKSTTDLEAANVGIVSEATKLRDDIVMWSDNYTAKIEGMVKSGNFKFDSRGSPSTTAKFDKKEVMVWKLPDGVSKPDFRHWADSVGLQLEAIHGFAYPDLVLDMRGVLNVRCTFPSFEVRCRYQLAVLFMKHFHARP